MKILPIIQNINTKHEIYPLKGNKIFFGNCSISNDIFESSGLKKEIYLKVYNPYTHSFSMDKVFVNFNRPQLLFVADNSRKRFKGEILKVDYDPNRTAYLIDKKTKTPIKTVILNTEKNNSVSYNFMSEDLQREYGYVTFTKWSKEDISNANEMLFSKLFAPYPEFKIDGERIIVDYLQNWDDNGIGGIGRLADKLLVKYCVDNNFPVKIVAVADRGSHMAHYIQGRRFLPIEKGSTEEKYYNELYGSSDINEILNTELKKNNNGGKIQLDMGFEAMYFPEELIQKCLKDLLSESQKSPKSDKI